MLVCNITLWEKTCLSITCRTGEFMVALEILRRLLIYTTEALSWSCENGHSRQL